MSASSWTTRMLPLESREVAWGTVISSGIHRGPRRCPRRRQFQMESGAAARPVGNFYRAAMLLDDTVGHREAQPRAFARRLGGKERIVDAMQVLRRNPRTRIGHLRLHAQAFRPGAHFERAARRHGVARVQK